MKKSQEEIVVEQLNRYGEISRNFCLKNYISRLSSIIFNLKKEGWKFEGQYRDYAYGKDYVYCVKEKPVLKLF